MKEAAWRLFRSEEGQDLVEYALLTVFVAMVGALAFSFLEGAMGNAYNSWDTTEQNLWEPEDP